MRPEQQIQQASRPIRLGGEFAALQLDPVVALHGKWREAA
jgi:hypothetical protein